MSKIWEEIFSSQGAVRRRLGLYVSDLNRDGICGSISVLVRRRIVLGSNGLVQLLRDFGNRYDHCFGVDHNIVCNLIVDFSNSVDEMMKITSVRTRRFLEFVIDPRRNCHCEEAKIG